jgi:hypothetical protein
MNWEFCAEMFFILKEVLQSTGRLSRQKAAEFITENYVREEEKRLERMRDRNIAKCHMGILGTCSRFEASLQYSSKEQGDLVSFIIKLTKTPCLTHIFSWGENLTNLELVARNKYRGRPAFINILSPTTKWLTTSAVLCQDRDDKVLGRTKVNLSAFLGWLTRDSLVDFKGLALGELEDSVLYSVSERRVMVAAQWISILGYRLLPS